MRACSGTWIAHGSGSADRETVDRDDRIAVPPGRPLYRIRPFGYARGRGRLLRRLRERRACAAMSHRARAADVPHVRLGALQAVNARFADAVVREAQRPDPICSSRIIISRSCPDDPRAFGATRTVSRSGTLPWPNPEAFAICPWRHQAARTDCSQHHSRLSHAVSLQQLPRHRRRLVEALVDREDVHGSRATAPHRRRRYRFRSSGHRSRWPPRRA